MKRARVGHLSAILSLLLCSGLTSWGAADPSASSGERRLTFEERVAAHRAVEAVYWRHRVWPEQNPGPKPPLSTVLSDADIHRKVEDDLLKSRALEVCWQRPVTSEQLQAEMNRMAKNTKAPEVLRELFAALDAEPWYLNSGGRYCARVGVPPVAEAGPDQSVECEGSAGSMVTADGSGSSDPDGDLLTCRWSSETCSFADSETCVTEATCLVGENVIVLVVNDGVHDSEPDGALITVEDTTPPSGSITLPEDGACLKAPVMVEDDFGDICDESLERAYNPGSGPTYEAEGAYDVTLLVEDDSGNTAEDSAYFIIDNTAPVVTLLAVPVMEQPFPRTDSLSKYYAASDEDAAPGDVLLERVYIDGCVVLDGDEYGNQNGILTDDFIDLLVPLLCLAYEACGQTEYTDSLLTIEAEDCAGNKGYAAGVIPGHYVIDPPTCQQTEQEHSTRADD